MGERVRFLAEPRNDRVKGALLGKAIHSRESYVGPTPLDPSTWLRVSGPPGMDSGSGAGMTEGES